MKAKERILQTIAWARLALTRTIRKLSPYTPVIETSCRRGRFRYWEQPSNSQGKPVKSQVWVHSRRTHREAAIQAKRGVEYLSREQMAKKSPQYRAR